MFQIKRIADPRLAERVCASFNVFQQGAFAYGAFQDDQILATAAFTRSPEGCVTLCGADTGRKTDLGLIDGMARAAFIAQLRQGATQGRLGVALPRELRLALTKYNYALEGPFDLAEFFSKKCCGK